MTRNKSHSLPAWVNALSGILRPMAQAEANTAQTSRRVGSGLFRFDQMIGLTSYWVGVNNRFSQSTWTCVWTPLSMWFRAVFFIFKAIVLYFFIDIIWRKIYLYKMKRLKNNDFHWYNVWDWYRVIRLGYEKALNTINPKFYTTYKEKLDLELRSFESNQRRLKVERAERDRQNTWKRIDEARKQDATLNAVLTLADKYEKKKEQEELEKLMNRGKK